MDVSLLAIHSGNYLVCDVLWRGFHSRQLHWKLRQEDACIIRLMKTVRQNFPIPLGGPVVKKLPYRAWTEHVYTQYLFVTPRALLQL